jgi:glucokinase
VVGAGTGFGVAALARQGGREVVMPTEGGHMGFAPVDEVEIEVLKRLTAEFGRVSIERILSGPGLARLHTTLQQIRGEPAQRLDPAAITRGARDGEAACVQTVEQFCAILGGAAGDLALALGARGGVYLGGGIAPAIGDLLVKSRFRARFEAKGRLSPYLQAIPSWIIIHPRAALIAAARLLVHPVRAP